MYRASRRCRTQVSARRVTVCRHGVRQCRTQFARHEEGCRRRRCSKGIRQQPAPSTATSTASNAAVPFGARVTTTRTRTARSCKHSCTYTHSHTAHSRTYTCIELDRTGTELTAVRRLMSNGELAESNRRQERGDRAGASTTGSRG